MKKPSFLHGRAIAFADAMVPIASNKEVQDSSDTIGTIASTGDESVCAEDAEADEDVSDDGDEGSESTGDENPPTATVSKGHCTNFAVTFSDRSAKPPRLVGRFAAKDLKMKLRKLAKEHDYTPVRLANGIGLSRKEVKGWLNARLWNSCT